MNDDFEWEDRGTPPWMGCLVPVAMLVMGSILGYLAIKAASFLTDGSFR